MCPERATIHILLHLLTILVYIPWLDSYYTQNYWESHKIPVLYPNHSNIQKWKVFQWSNDEFWRNLITSDLHFIHISTNSTIFPYFDTKVASKYPNFKHTDYETINASRNLVIEGLQRSQVVRTTTVTTGDSHFYYSGNILLPLFHKLLESVNLSTVVDEKLLDKITALVWMGTSEVSTSPHYDSVNNIYIQLHGEKTFRLLPPNMTSILRLYGRYHPYACQTRITNLYCYPSKCSYFHRTFTVIEPSKMDVEECEIKFSDKSTESTFLDIHLIEISLSPGDILYIPAYWYHETIADSASASISLWWDSQVLNIMDLVYHHPLPIENDWPSRRKICSIFLFAEYLLLSLDKHISNFRKDNNNDHDDNHLFSIYVKELLINRYAEDVDLYKYSKAKRKVTNDIDVNDIDDINQKICPLCSKECFQSSIHDQQMEQKFQKSAATLSKLFIEIVNLYESNVQNGYSVMAIKISDFIEDMFDFLDSQNPTATYILYWLVD